MKKPVSSILTTAILIATSLQAQQAVAAPLGSDFSQAECMTIEQKYQALGGPGGFLGKAQTKVTPTPDDRGLYQHYRHGSIHWSPETCAHETHGSIRGKWQQLGWEQGFGYPITDETPTPDGRGRFNHFQWGSIYWHPATGAYEVHGAIRDRWAETGWEQGPLGYPIADERVAGSGSGRYSKFERGTIFWHPATGTSITMNDRWTQIANTPIKLHPNFGSFIISGNSNRIRMLGGSGSLSGEADASTTGRRVKVFGSLFIVDDEWFASNETGTFEVNESEFIPAKKGGAKLTFSQCVGDEVRVEMDTFAAAVEEDDSLNVRVNIRLFEGTGCGTQQLEGNWEEQMTIPAGESEVFGKFSVSNGADYVEISGLTISNAAN